MFTTKTTIEKRDTSMSKAIANNQETSKQNPTPIIDQNKEKKIPKTCEGCSELLFCEMSLYNDHRCGGVESSR